MTIRNQEVAMSKTTSKIRKYYENQSERYGEIVEVTIDNYRALNPSGDFRQTAYGIFEYDADGNMIEQVAVITAEGVRSKCQR